MPTSLQRIVLVDDVTGLPYAASQPQSPDEKALAQKTGYTVSTSYGTVAPGNAMVLYMQNPAGSGFNIIFRHRLFTSTRANDHGIFGAPFAGTANPTTNLPTTVVTPGNRSGGPASVMIARANVMNTIPGGGSTPVGNVAGGGSLQLEDGYERLLAPGQSFAHYMQNLTSGLGNVDGLMCINVSFTQEPI